MKVRRRLSHIIASVLAMAILPGLLPVSVLAASDRALDITDYKATRLEDLTADDVIQYVYDGEGNKFYAPVDLSNTNTRMWLSYTVEKS